MFYDDNDDDLLGGRPIDISRMIVITSLVGGTVPGKDSIYIVK
jgi:hypothetical protein